jgi:hypothetical protein
MSTACEHRHADPSVYHPYRISGESRRFLIGNLGYLRDDRTGICFAYGYFGGPALATVACDLIPMELLSRPETDPLERGE